MIKRYLFACVSLLAGCYVTSHSSNLSTDRKSSDATVELDSDDKDTETEDSISTTLDSLTKEQSRAVCMQATDLSSECSRYALQEQTSEACEVFLQNCEESISGIDRYTSCEKVKYGEKGTCNVTESQYLNCVEAFEKSQSCEYVGKVIITPEQCWDVVTQCEALSDDFGRHPETIPACGSVGDETGLPQHDRDIYGADRCFPRPDRMVVLGDSISTCINFANATTPCECYWRNVASHIRDNYAKDLVLEGHYPDIPNGEIEDVVKDAQTIMGGPGHILVWVSAVAWDLLDLRSQIRSGDEDAPSIEQAVEDWRDDWQELFEYFTNRSLFPDGATFMLNTLYSPTDQCSESENETMFETLTMDEENAIQYANKALLIDVAQERDDTVTVDMYPDWLGHGHNYAVRACPFYAPDKAYWMSDDRHPNGKGYTHMGNKWKRAVDRMYGDNCF